MENTSQPQSEGRGQDSASYTLPAPGPPTLPPPPQVPAAGARREGLNAAAGAWLGCFGALVVLTVVFFFIVALAQFARGGRRHAGVGRPLGKFVGIVRVEGVIRTGDPGPLGPPGIAEEIIKDLKAAGEDNDCAAVVMRINSPGGSAAASQEIAAEVLKLKRKKPVIISMGDVAASGGYYIAAVADSIVANPATITGSIGVITDFPNLEGLFRKLGINLETVKSGPYKDLGNPARSLTDEEREMVQKQILMVYDQFVKTVAEGRDLPEAEVRKLADGRIYIGEEALKHKLIDQLGTFQDALDDAAKRARLGAKYSTFDFSERPLLAALFGSPAQSLAHAVAEELSSRLGVSRASEGLMQSPGL